MRIKALESIKVVLFNLDMVSFEKLITDIAAALFDRESEVIRVEEALFTPKREKSVLDAQNVFYANCARYVRLCYRRGWLVSLFNSRLRQSCIKSVPQVVAVHFK
eukprot:Lankesteria_metandrocarpae@DN9301_c0_g1_i1.p1